MKKLLLIFFFTSLHVSAQLYKSHDWKKTPVFHSLNEEDKKLASVAIKEKYLIQYHKPIIGVYALYETRHSIIRVNTEKGIKRHNRVYIPMYNVSRVIDIKARVIHKDGKIINLNKDNIKELKNVEGYGAYKIFAIEGVEKDTQLEFIYTLKKSLSSLGSILVQKNYKIKNAEVIIRKPFLLSTSVKSYNGFPELEKKKVPGNKIAYTAVKEEIDAMINEFSSTSDANRMKVVYITEAGNSSVSNQWSMFSSNIRTNFIKINHYGLKVHSFK